MVRSYGLSSPIAIHTGYCDNTPLSCVMAEGGCRGLTCTVQICIHAMQMGGAQFGGFSVQICTAQICTGDLAGFEVPRTNETTAEGPQPHMRKRLGVR